MTDKKLRIIRIHDKLTGDVIFARAATRAGALNWHTADRFDTSFATADDMLGIPADQVKDATAAEAAA